MQALSRLLVFHSRFVEGEDFSTIMRVAFAVDIAHVRFHGRFRNEEILLNVFQPMAREPHFAHFRFSGRQPVVLAEFANGVARIFNGGFLNVHAAFVCLDVEVEHELSIREHKPYSQNDEHEHHGNKYGRLACAKRCHRYVPKRCRRIPRTSQ